MGWTEVKVQNALWVSQAWAWAWASLLWAAWHGWDARVPLRCRVESRIGNGLLGVSPAQPTTSSTTQRFVLTTGRQALRVHAATSARGRS